MFQQLRELFCSKRLALEFKWPLFLVLVIGTPCKFIYDYQYFSIDLHSGFHTKRSIGGLVEAAGQNDFSFLVWMG